MPWDRVSVSVTALLPVCVNCVVFFVPAKFRVSSEYVPCDIHCIVSCVHIIYETELVLKNIRSMCCVT